MDVSLAADIIQLTRVEAEDSIRRIVLLRCNGSALAGDVPGTPVDALRAVHLSKAASGALAEFDRDAGTANRRSRVAPTSPAVGQRTADD